MAVVVQNAGFGATWAGPIASLIMEKYLNDSLRPERLKEVERVSSANLMPSYLPREQFRQDSIRAFKWFALTKDTSYIRKYIKKYITKPAVAPIKETQNQIIQNNPVTKPRDTLKPKQKTAIT